MEYTSHINSESSMYTKKKIKKRDGGAAEDEVDPGEVAVVPIPNPLVQNEAW
jgi:hypothetical protein